MTSMTVTRRIAAPVGVVFRTVADIRQFSQVVPQIIRIEFLSDVRSGIGTRFRETRLMNGQEMATELAVTEYVENDRVRIVSDAGGTVWDTVFTVAAAEGSTELTMVMEARPYELPRPDHDTAHRRRRPKGGRTGHGRGEGLLRTDSGAGGRAVTRRPCGRLAS